MNDKQQIVCFGEILWDVFPDREVIGGAPFNVAMRLLALGADSIMISSLGNDVKGAMAMDYIQKKDFSTTEIQKHSELPTGQVLVHLDENKNASYEIVQPVAWDAITVTPQMVGVTENASLFVFGSLAARSEISRNTLFELLAHASYKVFDVNLRAPYYSLPLLEALMEQANFVKMNDDELIALAAHLGFGDVSLKKLAIQLKEQFALEIVCVTRGAEGAMLCVKDQIFEHSGFEVDVVDTVGAGDSFLACLLFELFQKRSQPENALEHACALGALVAAKQGASCAVTQQEVAAFILKNQ